MTVAATVRLIDAFDPRVTAFQTDAFSLAEDLDWLDRLRALQAPVGVILHAARILEVLVRTAGHAVGLACRVDGLSHCLRQLRSYQVVSLPANRLFDRLRELGNKARHVVRKVSMADAEQGYAIALRGLQWYFCEFASGPKLKCLCLHNQPINSLMPAEVAALLELLDKEVVDRAAFLGALKLDHKFSPLLVSPVLASALIETLLDGDHAIEAQTVLTKSLKKFPDDVRLRQLQGLLWSRAGRLKKACDWLEAIAATDSAADEETLGILAGAYKRRSGPAGKKEWLRLCHDNYETGWQRSQGTNGYLGINAAATALWLGRRPMSALLAESIRNLLLKRRESLQQPPVGPPRTLNCWDQVTLAEAYLLLEDWDNARQCYQEAVDRFPKQKKVLEVACEQADRDLRAMGRGDLIGAVFPG